MWFLSKPTLKRILSKVRKEAGYPIGVPQRSYWTRQRSL